MKKLTKSIQIDQDIHKRLKNHCDDKGLRLQKLIEKLIINEIK